MTRIVSYLRSLLTQYCIIMPQNKILRLNQRFLNAQMRCCVQGGAPHISILCRLRRRASFAWRLTALRVATLLALPFACARQYRLKPTAHSPQPIATPQMPPQPAHRKRRSHVSRLAVSRLSPQMPPQPPTPLIKKSSRSDTCISSPITHHSSLFLFRKVPL